MKKIEIFVGSDSAFEKIVPKSARNLSEMAAKLDDGNKKIVMCLLTFQGSQNQSLRKRRNRECKILLFMQMSTVVLGTCNYKLYKFLFSKMSITNMYIQNPPKKYSGADISNI